MEWLVEEWLCRVIVEGVKQNQSYLHSIICREKI